MTDRKPDGVLSQSVKTTESFQTCTYRARPDRLDVYLKALRHMGPLAIEANDRKTARVLAVLIKLAPKQMPYDIELNKLEWKIVAKALGLYHRAGHREANNLYCSMYKFFRWDSKGNAVPRPFLGAYTVKGTGK